MKVGLIGESVTMHYLDYYCEKHKDRIAGFSDVRDDKKYQEDDIDFVVYRKDGSSFTVEAKADTYKTGNVFLETAVNSFAIGEDDKLLRFGKYQKAIAKHSKGWLYKEADYIISQRPGKYMSLSAWRQCTISISLCARIRCSSTMNEDLSEGLRKIKSNEVTTCNTTVQAFA